MFVRFCSYSPGNVNSAILRTRRYNLTVRQAHHSQKSGARAVSGSACLGSDHFAEGGLEISVIDVARAEKRRRRPFKGPGLHLFSALGVDDQFDVRISPIDFAKSTAHSDSVIEVKKGRHIVVRPCGASQ